MTTPDVEAIHRALVERLTAELRPVRRLWSPWHRLAAWVAFALATVGFAAIVGLRHDLAIELARPRYVLSLAILLAGAGLGATVALLGAVPGRIGNRQVRRIGLGLLLLAVTAALLGEPVAAHQPMPEVVLTGARCTACVALFGFVPWLLLFRAVARAAPLDGRLTGLAVGVAAFLVGAAAVRVACPIDDVVHLALWHGTPVALWTAASTVTGGAWLARWLGPAAAAADDVAASA